MGIHWIEWHGGECPEPLDSEVVVEFKDGGKTLAPAGHIADQSWAIPGHIVRYTCNAQEFLSEQMQRVVSVHNPKHSADAEKFIDKLRGLPPASNEANP